MEEGPEDNNESSERDASNERPPIGSESSLGNSGVTSFPLELSNGAGCRGVAKGDPIGERLTSHASSFIVCSGVLGVNPVEILFNGNATNSLGGVEGGSIPEIRGSCLVGVGVGVPPPANNFLHLGSGPLEM